MSSIESANRGAKSGENGESQLAEPVYPEDALANPEVDPESIERRVDADSERVISETNGTLSRQLEVIDLGPDRVLEVAIESGARDALGQNTARIESLVTDTKQKLFELRGNISETQEHVAERGDLGRPLSSLIEKIRNPDSSIQRSKRQLLIEDLGYIEETLSELENSEDASLALLSAYRGLKRIRDGYGLDGGELDIQQIADSVSADFRVRTGCEIEEFEDLDADYESTRDGIKNLTDFEIESLTEEERQAYKGKFEKYFKLKSRIESIRKELLPQANNFYKRLYEKVLTPVLESVTRTGEQVDTVLGRSGTLAQYLGNYGVGRKTARVVRCAVVGAMVLGAVLGKTDILEAAETEEANDQDRVKEFKSAADIKREDPELYRQMVQDGFIKETPGETPIPEVRGDIVQIPDILDEGLKNTGAEKLLATDIYKSADSPAELKSLYDRFNEKDQNPQDEIALAVKYGQFLEGKSVDQLISQYGRDTAEAVFQQAGYVTLKAIENYYSADLSFDNTITTEGLRGYLEGFQSASRLFNTSLDLSDSVIEGREVHKGLKGLVEMNSALTRFANQIMVHGSDEDRHTAAGMRNLVADNLEQLDRLPDSIDVVPLGDGKFLYPNTEKLAEVLRGFVTAEVGSAAADQMLNAWVDHDAGGVMLNTHEILDYLNGAVTKGPLSAGDLKLVSILTSSRIIERDPSGFASHSPVKTILFSSIDAYSHESQHHDFETGIDNNPELVKYHVNHWNQMNSQFKAEFVRGMAHLDLKDVNLQKVVSEPFTFEEVQRLGTIQQQRDLTGYEKLRYTAIQEFAAYTVDGQRDHIYDSSHEILRQPNK